MEFKGEQVSRTKERIDTAGRLAELSSACDGRLGELKNSRARAEKTCDGGSRWRAGLCGFGSAVTVSVALLVMATCDARAQETAYTLTIRNHRFEPAEIEIPAGQKVSLVLKNLDPSPERFDSIPLRREQAVAGGQEVTIYIGPLRRGRYEFFGHFNPKTARGHITVK